MLGRRTVLKCWGLKIDKPLLCSLEYINTIADVINITVSLFEYFNPNTCLHRVRIDRGQRSTLQPTHAITRRLDHLESR